MLCTGCGQRIQQSYILHNGVPYHEACYAQMCAPRCAYCQKPLLGEYRVDYWGTTFCPEHQGTYPHCCFCGRLVPTQFVRQNSSGQIRCNFCQSQAVETSENARVIFKQLVHWFHHQGLSCNNLNLQIELRDLQQFQELHQQHGHQPWGLTLHKYLPSSGERILVERVVLLRGLPSMIFQGVALHELGHVWLATYVRSLLPPWAEEGFCELIAYHFYSQITTQEGKFHAERIAQNPDTVYGEGFRRVHSIARQIGFQGLLDTLRKTRRMPGMP